MSTLSHDEKVEIFRGMLGDPKKDRPAPAVCQRIADIIAEPRIDEYERCEMLAAEMSRSAALMEALSGTFDQRFDAVFAYESQQVGPAYKHVQGTMAYQQQEFAKSRAACIEGLLGQTSTIRAIFGGNEP